MDVQFHTLASFFLTSKVLRVVLVVATKIMADDSGLSPVWLRAEQHLRLAQDKLDVPWKDEIELKAVNDDAQDAIEMAEQCFSAAFRVNKEKLKFQVIHVEDEDEPEDAGAMEQAPKKKRSALPLPLLKSKVRCSASFSRARERAAVHFASKLEEERRAIIMSCWGKGDGKSGKW